jgi:hypothetical protein
MIQKTEREKETNLYGLDKRIWDEDLKSTKPLSIKCPI